MTPAELLAYRLFQQGVLTVDAPILQPFTQVIGIQAQNQRVAELTVALQTQASMVELTALYQTRQLVRSWGQRWTLHLYTAADWQLMINARQTERLPKAYFEGQSEQVYAVADEIAAVLQHRELSKTDYLACVAELVPDLKRSRNFDYAVLQVLEAQGRAVMQGQPGQSQFHLFRPAFTRTDQQLATQDLIRRYLTGFGPATLTDFVKWSGVKIGKARPAWRVVEPELTPVTVAGKTLWLMQAVSAQRLREITAEVADRTLIAPRFSSLMTGYQQKGWLVDPKLQSKMWTVNGILMAPIIANGQLVGHWNYQISGKRMRFTVTRWGEFDQPVVERFFQRIAEFCQLTYDGISFTD